MRLTIIAIIFVVVFAPHVAGQSDFSGLMVTPEDVVFVTDATGKEISGRVVRLTAGVLELNGNRVVTPTAGLVIERSGDSIGDGPRKDC
jgi:hypothetical protein